MAKEKPQRVSVVMGTMSRLENQEKEILEKKDTLSIELIPINKIYELTYNGAEMHNRIAYDGVKFSELVNSIKEISSKEGGILGTGLLNPLMLRRKNNRLERIHGKHREEALLFLGKDKAPCVVYDNIDDDLARFMRISENLNRDDLNPYDETLSILEYIYIACSFSNIEKAKSFINKVKNFSTGKVTLNEKELELQSHVSVALRKVGRYDIASFANRLSLLSLNPLLIQALKERYINQTQCTYISQKIKKDEDIKKILELLKIKKMSIAELSSYIDELTNRAGQKVVPKSISILKSSSKIITKDSYEKLNNEERAFVDLKAKEIEKIHNEIRSRIGK